MRRAFYLRLGVWLFAFAFGCWPGVFAASSEDAPPAGFAQGNALYAAGKYADAASAYESVVRAGTYSANLFYNLGNAYARLGQRGRAILSYRRALLLQPGHVEAKANLSYLQGHDGGSAGAGNSWLSTELDLPDIDLLALLAAAAGWLGCICLFCTRGSRRSRFAAATGCWAVCAWAGGAIWWLDDGAKDPTRAIVLADSARALYAPADNSTVLASLPAGSAVRVLSAQGDWVYARLPDGSPAWLAATDVERVIPPR